MMSKNVLQQLSMIQRLQKSHDPVDIEFNRISHLNTGHLHYETHGLRRRSLTSIIVVPYDYKSADKNIRFTNTRPLPPF